MNSMSYEIETTWINGYLEMLSSKIDKRDIKETDIFKILRSK